MVTFDGSSMKVHLKRAVDDSYDIAFGVNLFPMIAQNLREERLCSRYAIITDNNVRNLWLSSLEEALRNEGLSFSTFSFPAGEQSKTRETKDSLIDAMLDEGMGKDTGIISLGGGVVGDIAGYIATVFLRGVPYWQYPTTLLAQADSSLGGKTGIDTKHAKNAEGTIKQPIRDYIDVSTLTTLSDLEYSNGLAETAKHAVIQDAGFFTDLQRNADLILKRYLSCLLYIAKQNCRIKGTIVEQDPNEKGLRMLLNYGHTIGHPIETVSSYQIPHGHSISMGMMVAGEIAVALGFFPESDLLRQEQLLQRMTLPTRIPPEISTEEILRVALADKKARKGNVRYVLPITIGRMHTFDGAYATPVEEGIVRRAIERRR